jgi:cobyrinic acid a,c-diamide synthase
MERLAQLGLVEQQQVELELQEAQLGLVQLVQEQEQEQVAQLVQQLHR